MKENLITLKIKRVKITILNRKNLWGIVVFVGLMFFFVGCYQHKKLTEKDMLSIQYNMTKEGVRKKIGDPKKIIQNSDKVRNIDKNFSETSNDRLVWENPNLYVNFVGSKEKLKEVNKIMEYSQTLTAYQYAYQNKFKEKSTWTIYFNKDKVIWMSFP